MNSKNTITMLFLLSILFGCTFSNTNSASSLKSDDKKHYLALGDSYTIGQSVSANDNFPNQLVTKAKGFDYDEPEIIATTGWRTDQLIKKVNETTLKYEKYDLVTLLIGVNDEFQGNSVSDYDPQFRTILDKAIKLAGNDPKKVWVFSIPDYGYTPYGKDSKASISKRIDEFNVFNKKIAKKKGVNYLDITPISRKGLDQPELIANDGLHPSGLMYELWIDEFLKRQ